MLVLYVEDNETNSLVMKHMLATAGIEIAEAREAYSGLKMVDQQSFELILMDLRMPGMDGLEATRLIRSRTDAKSEIPILMVTADMGADVSDDCLSAGADGLLHKPFDLDALFDAIAQTMSKRPNSPALLV
jgi:CheY-like chemotaxis protein